MSNKISRRTFLKCTGASAAALGAAAMLGGCGSSTSNAIEVKVGDKVSNWNNLGVQLTSVFTMANTPDLPDHEYVAVLVTAVNRSGATTFNIGAQNLAELDAAYPLNDEATKLDVARQYFHALAASTTDFTAVCDGAEPRWALTSSSMMPPLRASLSPPICPAGRRLHPADLLRPYRLAEAERHLHPHLRGKQEPHLLSELF
mgnify:CR=1 FL=1